MAEEQSPLLMAHVHVCEAMNIVGRDFCRHGPGCKCGCCQAYPLLRDAGNLLAWEQQVRDRKANDMLGPPTPVFHIGPVVDPPSAESLAPAGVVEGRQITEPLPAAGHDGGEDHQPRQPSPG